MSGSGRFKLLGAHRQGCRAADDPDGFTFIVHPRGGGYDFSRRKNGDRGGSTLWFKFSCNGIDCPAVALVRWDVLSRFVTEGIAANAPAPVEEGAA